MININIVKMNEGCVGVPKLGCLRMAANSAEKENVIIFK
jgi:hypothetical protein